MAIYILKRFVSNIVIFWIIITIVFSLVRLIPEGPFVNGSMSAQIRSSLEATYGLSRPSVEQYFMYITNLVRGNFGVSMIRRGHNVTEVIGSTFATSAIINFTTVFFSVILGIILGARSVLYRKKITNRILSLIITLANSIPSFITVVIVLHILESRWRLWPPTGFDGTYHYIVPIIALGIGSVAFVARLIHFKLMDIKDADYMRTAKAKGLSTKAIIMKHGLRNSLISSVRYLTPLVAMIFTWAFVAESIFSIPGLAREFVQAVVIGDYTMLLGITTFFCMFLIISNFIADMLHLIINPRIRQ